MFSIHRGTDTDADVDTQRNMHTHAHTHLGIERPPPTLNQHHGQYHRLFPGLSRSHHLSQAEGTSPMGGGLTPTGAEVGSVTNRAQNLVVGRLSGSAREGVRLRRRYLSPAIPRITCGILTPCGCLRVPMCLLGPLPLENSLPSPEKQEPCPSPVRAFPLTATYPMVLELSDKLYVSQQPHTAVLKSKGKTSHSHPVTGSKKGTV